MPLQQQCRSTVLCSLCVLLLGRALMLCVCSAAELAQQVGRVVRALSQGGLRVRSAIMTGGQQDEDRRHKTFRTQVRQCLGSGGEGEGGMSADGNHTCRVAQHGYGFV